VIFKLAFPHVAADCRWMMNTAGAIEKPSSFGHAAEALE
jgi:hypothetical protein